MGRRTQIPKSATVVGVLTGIVVGDGPNKGKRVIVTRYAGYASQGYATNYTATPHQWIEIRWPDGACRDRRVYQYSGKNLEQADAIWQDCQQQVSTN